MKLKKSFEDLKKKIKNNWKENFVWHLIRNITFLAYYTAFVYVIYRNFISVETITSKVKIAFSGVSIIIISAIIFFVRITNYINGMQKGYLKILYRGLFSILLLFSFAYLFKFLQNYSIDLYKFFMFLVYLGIFKLIFLLLDHFVYCGYKADYEENGDK